MWQLEADTSLSGFDGPVSHPCDFGSQPNNELEKKMRKILSVLLSCGVVSLFSGIVRADDCLCAKAPIYQVSGNIWYHYAVVYDFPVDPEVVCRHRYPTGWIGTYSMNQECTPNCDYCTPLGATATSGIDLHFDGDLKTYEQLDAANEFLDYVVSISANPHVAAARYANFNFTEHRVVKLTRYRPSTMMSEEFYAIVWTIVGKQQYPANSGKYPRGLLGVEIENPGNVAWVGVDSQCQAVHSEKVPDDGMTRIMHTPVPGLLQVVIETFNVAFIRLHRDRNREIVYQSCRDSAPARPLALMAGGGSACCQVACVPVQCCSLRKPRKYCRVQRRMRCCQ